MKHSFALLCVLFAAQLYAQQVPETDTHQASAEQRTGRFKVGLVGGWDRNFHEVSVAYMEDLKYDKSADGLSYGISASYCPLSWLSVRADVVFLNKNYNMTHIYKNWGTKYVMATYTENQYLSVPLALELTAGKIIRVHVNAGGYAGYWLSSHRQGTSYSMTYSLYGDASYNNFDEDVEFNEVRDNRLDAGLVFGGGLSGVILKHIELGVEARLYYGLTDIQKSYMVNLSPRYNTTWVLQGGLSYIF